MFFAIKLSHRISWWHPRSHHWHQLDLIITWRPLLNCILITHSYHSAYCDTSCSLVGSKVHLQPKQTHQSKHKGCPHINGTRMSMPDLYECFADSIKAALNDYHTGNARERWNHICVSIYNSAMDTFGKRERQNPYWFEEGIAELEPVITTKRAVLVEYKRDPSEKLLTALRKTRNNAQQIAWHCVNDYWLNLCQSIQLSTVCGNICTMYDGMKKAFGSSTTNITPLKSITSDIITDWGKQMERWAEHYQELYLRKNTVTDSAVESTCTLPILKGPDIPPSVEELSKAIDSLACSKSSRKRWHPTNSHQGWQADCPPPPPPWASATVLGKGDRAPKYAWCHHHHLIQETRVTTVTATITMESPFSALLGRPWPMWCWTGCRCLLRAFTQKHSVDSGLEDWQSTWFSHYVSSKRSDVSRCDLCTLYLLTWPRLLT